MCCRVLQWYPGDHELAHDAAVARFLESRRQPRGQFEAKRAFVGWCLHLLKKRCWSILRRRSGARNGLRRHPGILGRLKGSADKARRCEAVYRALLKLPAESRELLEEWAYHGRSDRMAAEQQIRQSPISIEAARKAIQRRRQLALKELRQQVLIDQLEESRNDVTFA